MQAFLAFEVVIEHPLVAIAGRGDRIDAGSGESVGREPLRRGLQDPPTRALGVSFDSSVRS